jgi:hypothetical protein
MASLIHCQQITFSLVLVFISWSNISRIISIRHHHNMTVRCTTGVHKSRERGLNVAQWHLLVIGPQCGTCYISPFWRLEFWRSAYTFEKFVHPCYKISSSYSAKAAGSFTKVCHYRCDCTIHYNRDTIRQYINLCYGYMFRLYKAAIITPYKGESRIFRTDAVKFITLTTKCVWKLPTSTQLRATWYADSLYIVVLPSNGASRYHNCCIVGGTSPKYFGLNLVCSGNVKS